MILSNMLSGKERAYTFSYEQEGLVYFNFHDDEKEYAEIDLEKMIEISWPDAMAIYSKSIKKFMLELNRFPIYIHSISESMSANLAKDAINERIDSNNIYHRIKISSEKEFLYYFPKAYQDAYDNQSVIFSSEETIEMDFTKSSLYFKKFILKFPEKNKECFYLWIVYDGNGFDFISKFSNHPFQNEEIEDDLSGSENI